MQKSLEYPTGSRVIFWLVGTNHDLNDFAKAHNYCT